MSYYEGKYAGAKNDPLAWTHGALSDGGFFNYQRCLRAGSSLDVRSATTDWGLCADSVRTVADDLGDAYRRISQTWSGEAANAFYEELAKVQNYAVSLLMQIDSSLAKEVTLISTLAAASAGATGTAPGTGRCITPHSQYSGAAMMARRTTDPSASPVPTTGGAGSGDGMIAGDMISILNDSALMMDKARKLAGNTLPDPAEDLGSAFVAELRVACWLCGQVSREPWQDALRFFSELAGVAITQMLAPETIAVLPAVVEIVATLNTPATQPVRELILGSMTVKVLLDTLAWYCVTPDAGHSPPSVNMNALAFGWVTNAKGLPGRLDPSLITNDTGAGDTSHPGYPGPEGPSLPGGAGPTSTPHMQTPPLTTPKLTSPSGPGGPGGPNDPATWPKTGTGPFADTGLKPYDPHGASLASFDPHSGPGSGLDSGLGGGPGFGGGSGPGGLDPNGGALASYDPHAGPGSGLGDGTNGAGGGPGTGDGAGGGGSAGGAAGASGRGMPMSPGSGAGGNKDDKGRNRTAFLSEDEEVWGVGDDVADGVL